MMIVPDAITIARAGAITGLLWARLDGVEQVAALVGARAPARILEPPCRAAPSTVPLEPEALIPRLCAWLRTRSVAMRIDNKRTIESRLLRYRGGLNKAAMFDDLHLKSIKAAGEKIKAGWQAEIFLLRKRRAPDFLAQPI